MTGSSDNSLVASIRNRTNTFAGTPVAKRLRAGRCRLGYRWLRFAFRSTLSGDFDFVVQGLTAVVSLPFLWLRDLVRAHQVLCPICLWEGYHFYPNVGPGYNERRILCPGCGGLARQRDLLILLVHAKSITNNDGQKRIVEVAPMRGFERLMQGIDTADYTSFDIERNAMIRGDITDMPFDDSSVDLFICFHVLEHIPKVDLALSEIVRVLKPSGKALIQVPVDWSLEHGFDYDEPDPREVGHVRRYGQDVRDTMARVGLAIVDLRSTDFVEPDTAALLGLSDEIVFSASRTN